MLTVEMIEAEFWGLEREQPVRTRLRQVVALVLRHCLDKGVDAVLQELGDDVRREDNAVFLVHRLQTEIGQLRTEIAELRKAQPLAQAQQAMFREYNGGVVGRPKT